MALNSLIKTRIFQMGRATGTEVTERHLRVLDYALHYYRKNSVGPLYQNIKKFTGVSREEISSMFPNGLASVYVWIGIPIQSTAKGCKPMALLEVDNVREVYLDHNATTPLRPEVISAMVEFLQDNNSYGNPSSSYTVGSAAFDVIERARGQVAKCLNVEPEEIYFVGSGSEANNLAIKGIVHSHESGHIITTSVEHPAVLETVKYLESQGYDATYLPVDSDGTLKSEQVLNAIRPDTILVSVMAANNEIGTIFPTEEIGAICEEKGIAFMVDGIQALGKIRMRPKSMGISMLTASGHKIYAPKGIGVIYIDKDCKVCPQVHGGSQEAGLRSGTENVVGIMSMGLAAHLACREMKAEQERFLELRNYFLLNLEQKIPDAVINGTLDHRLPHNLSVGFSGIDSGSVLLSLNQIGVYVSAGSACSAGSDKISHVLEAIGANSDNYGTIRFSFGKLTTKEDIDYLFSHLPDILKILLEKNELEDVKLAATG